MGDMITFNYRGSNKKVGFREAIVLGDNLGNYVEAREVDFDQFPRKTFLRNKMTKVKIVG